VLVLLGRYIVVDGLACQVIDIMGTLYRHNSLILYPIFVQIVVDVVTTCLGRCMLGLPVILTYMTM